MEVCENTFDRDIRNLVPSNKTVLCSKHLTVKARSIPKLNKSKPEQTDSIFCSELVRRAAFPPHPNTKHILNRLCDAIK